MEEIEFFCNEKTRIDDFLRKKLPEKIKAECSNSKIRRLIVSGQVFVNHKCVVRPSFELRGQSAVKVCYDESKFFYEKQPDDIKFEVSDSCVLYEDNDLIFIDKPPFFPVEQTIAQNRDNLHDAVVRYLWAKNKELRNPPYVGIMHRLDRETSGVIMFTKNRAMNKTVQQMFENHSFEKKYLAVVEQNPKYKTGDTFSVEMFMERISSKSQCGKWGVVPQEKGGKYSKTDFKILKKINLDGIECFLVECNLFTGRTHQIRVHIASKGLAILGDILYGGRDYKRIMLHSYLFKGLGLCINSGFVEVNYGN